MENKQSVEEYLAILNDEQTAKDSQVLIDIASAGTSQSYTMSAPSDLAPTTTSTTADAKATRPPSVSILEKIRSPST
jgi:FlaG/FlaF family flagellin (archaellin)